MKFGNTWALKASFSAHHPSRFKIQEINSGSVKALPFHLQNTVASRRHPRLRHPVETAPVYQSSSTSHVTTSEPS